IFRVKSHAPKKRVARLPKFGGYVRLPPVEYHLSSQSLRELVAGGAGMDSPLRRGGRPRKTVDTKQVAQLRKQGLTEPSQLRRISREIRVNRRGKFFALNKTFSQALVVETYPLCRRIKFWHSATENVSAQQYADQGWEGTPLLHGGGESASAVGESGAAAGVVPGRNQRQSA